MKLIVTADDYGISDAVTEGILKCARVGILTQTGLMTNFPGSQYAAERMKEYPHICLGQDINLVAGKPVSDPALIPSLIQENGYFKTSKIHLEEDKTYPEHIPYSEALVEVENQVKKYIDYVGHSPAYLSGHSYGTKETERATKDISEKYDIPLSKEFYASLDVKIGISTAPWNITKQPKVFPIEDQLAIDIITLFKEGKLTYLQEALDNNGIAHIHTHAGFVDEDIFRRSSFTFVRAKEADFLCSDELVRWVNKNHIELVSINDFQ